MYIIFFRNLTTTPLTYTSKSITVKSADLQIMQKESQIVITNGTTFNANFYLADKISGLALTNPSWKVLH